MRTRIVNPNYTLFFRWYVFNLPRIPDTSRVWLKRLYLKHAVDFILHDKFMWAITVSTTPNLIFPKVLFWLSVVGIFTATGVTGGVFLNFYYNAGGACIVSVLLLYGPWVLWIFRWLAAGTNKVKLLKIIELLFKIN